MLVASVINSDATLNNFKTIGALDFIPGYGITVVIQLKQPQKAGLRYVAAAGATLAGSFQNSDGTFTSVSFTAITGDASLWTADLTALQTTTMVGGNFTFVLTESAVETKGWVENGLSVVITGAC